MEIAERIGAAISWRQHRPGLDSKRPRPRRRRILPDDSSVVRVQPSRAVRITAKATQKRKSPERNGSTPANTSVVGRLSKTLRKAQAHVIPVRP